MHCTRWSVGSVLTDRVNSVPLVGGALAFTEEAVAEVAAAVVAADLALRAQSDVALARLVIEAHAVCIPPAHLRSRVSKPLQGQSAGPARGPVPAPHLLRSLPAVLELGGCRVEREVAALALEVARLREELAELALAIGLGAAPPEDVVLLLSEFGPPLLVRFLPSQPAGSQTAARWRLRPKYACRAATFYQKPRAAVGHIYICPRQTKAAYSDRFAPGQGPHGAPGGDTSKNPPSASRPFPCTARTLLRSGRSRDWRLRQASS